MTRAEFQELLVDIKTRLLANPATKEALSKLINQLLINAISQYDHAQTWDEYNIIKGRRTALQELKALILLDKE